MSYAGIRNGLVTTLTACGPWVGSEVSTCDFGILETTSGCAIVLSPGRDNTFAPMAHGATANQRYYLRNWKISGTLYVKDNGNSASLLSLVWQGVDDLYNTISKDDSLAATACAAMLTRVDFDKRFKATWAAVDFAPIEFEVEAVEL